MSESVPAQSSRGRFPTEPVRARLRARASREELTVTEVARALSLSARVLSAVMTRATLRWDAADRVAVALGCHPVELWPQWYDA